MPPNLPEPCDNLTTTAVAATSPLPSTCSGLRDQVSAWGADRRAPGRSSRAVRQRLCRLRRRAGRAGQTGRPRPPARRRPAAGRGGPAGELRGGRLGSAAAPTLPSAHPLRAPVVAVVLCRLGWWRTTGDPQGIPRPAAHSWPAGLTPP